MDNQVKVPCIVHIDKADKKGIFQRKVKKAANTPHCIIMIPDLNIDVKGNNFVETMAKAVEIVTALYYYYREHNLKLPCHTTWEEVDKESRKSKDFPTYINVQ